MTYSNLSSCQYKYLNAPVICMPHPLRGHCRDLTYDVSRQCRRCEGLLISCWNRPLLKELVWKVLLTAHLNILIPKETYITFVIFRGGGGRGWGPDLLTPTSQWIHNSEIKRIARNDRCTPNIQSIYMGYKLISLIVLMRYALDKFKYNKGQ